MATREVLKYGHKVTVSTSLVDTLDGLYRSLNSCIKSWVHSFQILFAGSNVVELKYCLVVPIVAEPQY